MRDQPTQELLSGDEQRMLFDRRLTWHELPKSTREFAIDLFAAMCVELVTNQQQETQELLDERSQN
jgi:hypothetical protein